MYTDKALPAERLNLPMRQVQCQISRPKSMSKSAHKSAKTLVFFGQPTFLLCSGGDLNPHALRHTPLKRTCLPFHHPSDSKERNLYHGRRVPQVFLRRTEELLRVLGIALFDHPWMCDAGSRRRGSQRVASEFEESSSSSSSSSRIPIVSQSDNRTN